MTQPKVVKSLTNMEIDEISLVDRGANQHATVAIAKRAPEEEIMPELDIEELFSEDGKLLDGSTLSEGDIVYDEAGNAYEYTLVDDEAPATEERELASVGKSFDFGKSATEPTPKSDFAKNLMEELSKAYSDEDRDKVISKAFARLDEVESRFNEVAKAAEAERDLRLTREYIAKADTYNLPIAGEELGPVLYRMTQNMSYEDCAVIHKALESSGSMIYDEIGSIGGGDNVDIMSTVTAQAATFGKSEDGKAIPEVDIVKALDANPELYDAYLAEKRF